MQITDSVESMMGCMFATSGVVACVARLRRSVWKKVLEAQPGLPPETVKGVKKSAPTMQTKFTAEFTEAMDTNDNGKQNKTMTRLTRIEDLPGDLLGFDYIIEHEIEKHLKDVCAKESVGSGDGKMDVLATSPVQTLDRNELADRILD